MDDFYFHRESVALEKLRTAKLRDIFARRGFFPSSDINVIARALALGESSLGGGLVGPETMLSCELKTERCFFAKQDEAGEVSGFIALLYLNRAGYEALMFGQFNPADPDLSHLTKPDERASALYVWCLAGADEAAKRSVVRSVTEARRRAFPDIALFARPVSREGRMMTAALDAPGAGAAWLGWVPAYQNQVASPEIVEG